MHTFERICFPLSRSESLLSQHRARYCLAFLWTFNVAITCPILVWNKPLEVRCNKNVFYPVHYHLVISTTVVAIMVTTVLYARLFCVASRHRLAIQALNLTSAAGSSGHVAVARKEAKLTKTGGMLIGLLYASWLPYIIGNSILGDKYDLVSRVERNVIFLILASNSMINPILYQRRIPEFHTAFRKLMPCLRTSQPPISSS